MLADPLPDARVGPAWVQGWSSSGVNRGCVPQPSVGHKLRADSRAALGLEAQPQGYKRKAQ
eukprot:2432642-Alexandrium_andersonii.AAC.1